MTYRVEISEGAEAEAEAALFWMLGKSPERAGDWYKGLLDAIATLSEMPQRWPVARNQRGDLCELRQLLYGRRRSAYRVLYNILESQDADDQPVVRVLHVRHASRQVPESLDQE